MTVAVLLIPPSHLLSTIVVVFADDAAGKNIFGYFLYNIHEFQLFSKIFRDGTPPEQTSHNIAAYRTCRIAISRMIHTAYYGIFERFLVSCCAVDSNSQCLMAGPTTTFVTFWIKYLVFSLVHIFISLLLHVECLLISYIFFGFLRNQREHQIIFGKVVRAGKLAKNTDFRIGIVTRKYPDVLAHPLARTVA